MLACSRSRNGLGGFWDDVTAAASTVINNAQGAASAACALAPAAEIVAGAAGSGNVQEAANRVNAICGNKPVGASSATAATSPKYPSTCLTRYNRSHNTWSVYCPPGVSANHQGFGMYGMYQLGAGDVPVSPAAPAGFVKIASEAAQPTGATVMSPNEEKDMPWYKNWKVLLAIGGGVAVVGTSGYLLTRK